MNDKFSVVRTTVLTDVWSPKDQVEINDAMNKDRSDMREKINKAEAGLERLKKDEEALGKEIEKNRKHLRVDESRRWLISKLRGMLEYPPQQQQDFWF